ncbi:MAG TPA: DUF5916 domain-containing protein [Gemmatimonadaceae bacterium]|nr:DUF5916 domain-containing protein [Gemmatimonadaceae bacterium]
MTLYRTDVLHSWIPLAALLFTAAPQDTARPVATATRVRDGAIIMDGRLDEPEWKKAIPVTHFTQVEPILGAEPTERTTVLVVYDDDALYIGAHMFSRDPSAIQSPISRRDDGGQAEHLTVSLDTYLDRRTAYNFGVTASGVRLDYYQPEDNDHSRDESYDPVWDARTQRTADGWTAEMRIPFSQLRFNDRPELVWGMNLDRWIPSKHEDDYWIPVPRNVQAWSSRFGNLVGIAGVAPSRRLELVPYVATNARMQSDRDVRDPFSDATEVSANVGGDLKMGLGPNLTLEGTFNPDFGQVEADPAEVNLTAFETFFDEKRPFFTEGSRLLSGNGPSYFYSRRIGAPPRGDIPGDPTFVDQPNTTTILGAAKLTGRLASGTSIGTLVAMTGREFARTFDTLAAPGDGLGRVEVAPRSLYGVTRVQQELGTPGSTVGAMLAGVYRDMPDGSPLAASYDRAALSGGSDWTLRLGGGDYELSGYAGFSYVRGDTSAMIALQQSSARYFQRPDAAYVRVDSARTSLAGYTASLNLRRITARHWLWGAGFSAESPGFELNDAGRLQDADNLGSALELQYRETLPGAHLRTYDVGVSMNHGWNYGGTHTNGDVDFDADITLLNYWQLGLSASLDQRALSPTLTRGGPLMGTPRTWSGSVELGNNFVANVRWQGRVRYEQGEEGGRELGVSGSLSVRPAPAWQLSIEPSYSRETDPRQFVTTEDNGPAETFGTRYIFAATERTTFSTQFRLNYTFKPDLTLEMYAEPFAANVHFRDFGELAAARSRALRLYGHDGASQVDTLGDGTMQVTDGSDTFTLDNEDFVALSFRSNVVLRWEWRAGSTLFVVWQQDRGRDDPLSRSARFGDLFHALSTRGENIFAIKATVWIPAM